MTIRFSDNWLGRTAGAVVHGTNFSNALGGSGTTAIERTSATHYLAASATAGLLGPGNPTASYIAGVAGNAGVFDGKIRMLVDISGGRNAVRVKGAGTSALGGVQVTLNATHTSLQISTGTSTPSQAVTAPPGNFWLELEVLDLSCTARLLNAGDLAVLATFTVALPSTRVRGGYWSGLYGAAATPINTLLGSVIMDDMATGAAPPTISSVTAAKNGKYAATGSITSSGTNGKVFYKWYAAADTPTAADIMSTGTTADWTSAGAIPVSTAGLTAGLSYKLAAVRRDSGLNVSTVVVSSTFTTDAPLAAPTGTASRTVSGQTVRVVYTPGAQPVASVSVSIPAAASSPGGAVAQGPTLAVFDDALDVWVAEFTAVPAGSYGPAVVLASNEDNPSVSITGAAGFSIVGMDGQPTAPDIEPPAAVAPAFSLQPSNITVTAGLAGSIGWASTGTEPIAATLYTRANSGASWDGGTVVTSPHNLGVLALSANGRQHRVGLVNEANPGAPVYSDIITVTVVADTIKPVMQGTVSLSAVTTTSHTTGCDVATDNVGVTGYRVSLDGGVNWIDKGAARIHNATGRTPGSTDAVWWSARDAAGNWADPITRDVALVEVPAPVITQQPQAASVVEGTGATMNAAATVSSGALSWQWFSRPAGDTSSGTPVSGGTSASLQTGNLLLAQNGIQYRARARNTISGATVDTYTGWAAVTVEPLTVLPPGPGGVLSGISPPTLFQLLALAGD